MVAMLGGGAAVASLRSAKVSPGPQSKTTEATIQNWPVTNYVAYTDGKAGRANSHLSPVDLGWVNMQGGVADIAPEATIAAEFSVNYVNKYLGGIGGHPLKLVECFIPDTVAAASSCGASMADNPHVQQIVIGAPLVVGNEAFESALQPTHKLLNMFFGLPVDSGYEPAVWFYGSATSLEGPIATFLATALHAKTVAIIGANTPGNEASLAAITLGLTLEHVKYSVATYDPSTTDLVEPLVAANATSADVIEAGESGSGCGNLYQALRQLDITKPVVLGGPTCDTPSVAASTGGVLPRWYFAIGSSLYSDKTDPAATALRKAFATDPSFSNQYVGDTWADTTFSQILTAAKFMNEAGFGHLGAKNLANIALHFRGPMLWGPPHMTCGQFKSTPQICLDEDQFFRPNAAGVPIRVGTWVSKPKAEPVNG